MKGITKATMVLCARTECRLPQLTGSRHCRSGEECRNLLRNVDVSTSVLIADDLIDVDAINLAAALRRDAPRRAIFLLVDHPSGSLRSRAQSAGVTGIIEPSQLEHILSGPDDEQSGVQSRRPDISPSIEREQTAHAVLGVASGRGGVGKSVVALLAALLAQRKGLRVVLLDLDLQFGDLSYLAGKEITSQDRSACLSDAVWQEASPRLEKGELMFIESPSQPEQAEGLVKHLPGFLDRLTTTADLVVVNTARFWTEVHPVVAQCCAGIMLLMDQRGTSVRGCRCAAELCVRMGIPTTKFLYVLNRCDRRALLTTSDVSAALGGATVFPLSEGGSEVDELLELGVPGELIRCRNPLVVSLDELLDTVLSLWGIIPRLQSVRRKERQDVAS